MRRMRGALVGCAPMAAWLVMSCADGTRVVAPELNRVDAAPSNALLGGLLGDVTSLLVAPVQRKVALADDVTWTFYAGPGGATSTNTATGLTIRIPSGALATGQMITVTAPAGSAVAYSFSPHLTFSRSVVLTQDLRVTTLGLLSLPILSGAHFPGDELLFNDDGLALVDELVSAVVNPLTRTVSFGVGHFSGWIVASGKSSGGGY
jgi:hypothetical protein